GPNGTFVQLADAPAVERSQRPVVDLRVVSPAYFHVLSLRLRHGRALSELDRERAPLVTVINETMARRFFPGDNPIGRQLLMDQPAFGATSYAGDAVFEIVGVVADERVSAFADPREHAAVYVSYEQQPDGFAGIVVRTAVDAGRIERALRAAIAAVDKDQPVQ